MTTPPDLITTGELARTLGVTSTTIDRWVAAGHLTPTTTTFGGHRRFNLDHARRQLAAAKADQ